MPDTIAFVLNGQPVTAAGVSPAMTLLDWLRGPARLTGTKEGCAEGDCGACTVALEQPPAAGGRSCEPANACLLMMGQVHGRAVRTVEGLRDAGGTPHPVQRALADGDGTQCGYCTPGIIMSMYAFAAGGEPPEAALIHDALAGNLCRCTGYRPIVEAMARVAQQPDAPLASMVERPPAGAAAWQDGATRFDSPTTLDALLALRRDFPDAWLLAGGTDLGLRVSHDRDVPAHVVHVARVPELQMASVARERLRIGAALTYAGLLPYLADSLAPFGAMVRRLGSRQIRALGTIGGNLGTASPIGDTLPVLLALDATIHVRSAARGPRAVASDAFFLGYRRTALAADDIIEAIDIKVPQPGEVFHVDKVSKRRDQDISAVLGAYRLRIEDGVVRSARLAFGGMAATPARARQAEAALIGQPWGDGAIDRAAAALARDFQPLDDWRGSAAYRLAVAGNLLRRLYWRTTRPDAVLEVDQL
ncbi:xanthine dehydrogenase small subunit [Reyranella sp. CPCC 100927]|uniref:xanthine dehydrogenase small subunit n=1 Tax=Reyranella sp. CPCC 100927 TaxID=2599616 RepID=UPI0011B85382|nr:xanthine dehydrogenase small subunit [Reyranella sp. CPCC 100927]TWT08860.1 xanthine dehydrogenase small subunit [Reyranella sp. CPCC 100927]